MQTEIIKRKRFYIRKGKNHFKPIYHTLLADFISFKNAKNKILICKFFISSQSIDKFFLCFK